MRFFLWLVVFCLVFVAAVRYIERHSICYPMKKITVTPADAQLPYEEVYFDTSDGKRLCGWFVPRARAEYTVIFCHGNAGNISHRLEKLSMLHDSGLNVFIFDYRGYGKSEGVPSEQGLYKDAETAYNYLIKKRGVSEDSIILFGESIGGAVAVDLAWKENPRALITEGTFTSIKDMASTAYPFIPHFVFSSRYDAASRIKDVICPKLIIHSRGDEIVPFALGEKLFIAAAPKKEFLEINGSHNTAFLNSEERFRKGIKSFLDGLSSGKEQP